MDVPIKFKKKVVARNIFCDQKTSISKKNSCEELCTKRKRTVMTDCVLPHKVFTDKNQNESLEINIKEEPQDTTINNEIDTNTVCTDEHEYEDTGMNQYSKEEFESQTVIECDPLAFSLKDINGIKCENDVVEQEFNEYQDNYSTDLEEPEGNDLIIDDDPMQTRVTDADLNTSGNNLLKVNSSKHEDSSVKSADVSRKRKYVSSSVTALEIGYQNISDMGTTLELPKFVIEQANDLLRHVHESKILKFRHRLSAAAPLSCLYIACRQADIPRTFKEVSISSGVSKTDIGRCFKLILKDLGIIVDHCPVEEFISQFCYRLGYPNIVRLAATRIAMKGMDVIEKIRCSPISVAAAAIYFAAQAVPNNENLFKDIGDLTGVTESTMKRILILLIPYM